MKVNDYFLEYNSVLCQILFLSEQVEDKFDTLMSCQKRNILMKNSLLTTDQLQQMLPEVSVFYLKQDFQVQEVQVNR